MSRPQQPLGAAPTHLPPESGLMPKFLPASPATALLVPPPSLQGFPSTARASPTPGTLSVFATPALLRTRNRNQQCSLAGQAGSQRQGLGAQGRGPAGQAPRLEGGPHELWQGWKEAPLDGQSPRNGPPRARWGRNHGQLAQGEGLQACSTRSNSPGAPKLCTGGSCAQRVPEFPGNSTRQGFPGAGQCSSGKGQLLCDRRQSWRRGF